MKKAEKKKRLEEIQNELDVQNFKSVLSRARAVTVGTSFGGVIEVSMRGDGGQMLWTPMQPVEAIELIHQLAANVGCHINLQPRKDFSSWRDWKYTNEQLEHYRGSTVQPGVGWAPHPHPMDEHMQVGANLPPPEQQPGLKVKVPVRSKENAVAIKKTVNRRNAKRSAKSS